MLHECLPQVLALAKQAGDLIMQVYQHDFVVTTKKDKSPVTEADLLAQQCIAAGLAKIKPLLPQISEEAELPPATERQSWHRYWLVDPLDGTREFVKRNGEFTVNIACVDHGRTVLGVVYVPVQGLSYYAADGFGAWKQYIGESAVPIRVSPVGTPLRVVGSRMPVSRPMQVWRDKLPEHSWQGIGSSLKVCLIAEGAADVYLRLGNTSEWDTAAAQCVLEAAGGKLQTLDGESLRYNSRDTLLNPDFCALGDVNYDWNAILV